MAVGCASSNLAVGTNIQKRLEILGVFFSFNNPSHWQKHASLKNLSEAGWTTLSDNTPIPYALPNGASKTPPLFRQAAKAKDTQDTKGKTAA